MEKMEKPVKAETREEIREMVSAVKMLFPHLSSVPEAEIVKAILLAKRLGLDPVKREVHFVPYKGSLQLIVGYPEYIKRAERSGKLNGWNIETGRDELDIYAEIVIYRKDWEHPFRWRVYLNEVKKDTPSWKSMPTFMLRKVAIAQGFRLAFPEEVSELPYTEDEISTESMEDKHTQSAQPTHSPVISEAQAKRLKAIALSAAKEKGIADEELKDIVKGILSEYNIENVDNIPKSVYDEIVEKIQERIKQG
jgi:phage recombination protein Bet